MIRIYECTDCKHCINFGDGFRIACGNPDFGSDEVYFYSPVGDDDAEACRGFDEGYSPQYRMEDIQKAVDMFGDDVSSLRKYHEWRKNEKNKTVG